MNSELSDAYYGVYCSSREILKNNQRHLFCNMLDLLTNTCKTTGISCKKISNDDSVQFWILRILPLSFDEDVSIQSSAVSALEQGLVNLDINSIHTSMHWPEIKNKIISSYAVRINKLREDKNDNWHKVWCLLITILDTDILKGASTINTFLAIVELGFRSPDNKIRAEAFLCWRRLIKTFSDYNELSSPKRLKLICIPLKSSQSKSSEAAEVKLRVWWYLFSCLGQQLESVFECTVEPFLSFCLGNPGRSTTTSAIHQYPSLRNLAITCIASLFATENNISIQRLINENNLEPIPQPSPLLSKFVIKKHWQPIASTILEAVRQINFSNDVSDCSLQLLHLLIRFTTVTSIRNCETSFFAYNCTELKKMLPDHTRPVLSWFNTFATEGPIIYTTFEDLKSYTSALAAVMELFCAARLVIPPSIFERCITHAFKFPDNDCIGSVLIQILDVVISASDDIDFETFQTKLLVWRHVSNNILLCLKENSFDFDRDNRDISTILNQWTIWPLKTCMSFAGHQSLENFDNSFATVWGKLLNARQNCAGRNHLLSAINLNLLELLTSRKEDASFPGLFDSYVSACLKYGIQQNSTTTKELFNLFNAVASAPLQGKSLELCLSTFKNMLNEFSNPDITSVFDSIKHLISKVGRPSTNEGIDTPFFEDWKREILDRIRTHPNKAFSTEIKDILLRNDVFVIIPSVWSLNPEKLTDRQKERYAEKHDIPALYNDMSQSQDALIKPWTPKKVVIAKEQHAEIVLKKTDANNASQNEAADTCAHENVCEEESSVENLKNDESPSKKALRSLPEPKGYSLRRLKNSSISDERFADVNDNDVSQRTRRSSLKIKPVEVMSKTEVSTNSSTEKSNKPTESPTLKKTSLTEDQSKEVKTYNEQQPSQSVIEITGGNIETVLKSFGENETHSSRKVITENNTDNQPHSIASFQTCRDNVLQKETSPKKANQIKFTPLQSPPDRKLINNTSSPTLRPKPSTHLTGRGAQLINMIRNKKPEPTPYYISTSLNKSNQQSSKDDKFCENHITDLTENNAVEVTLTPVQAKDLLIFSKRLPPPTASPSASILKRKFRRDSIDDLATDSPAFKRKRVSFHDPPVSVTKEYIRDIEDRDKSKLKRCLLPEKNTIVAEIKHALKRKSKLESIVEIEKYNFDRCKNDNDYDSTLKWNDSQNTSLEPNTSLREPNTNIAETLDYESALKIVVQNCSIETVLEQFFSSENLQLQRSASFLTKFLSNQMAKNTKITKDVLEILSENHSKAFLDHAIQENLSSVVCDRLNLNSVIDFVCAKSKINSACRSSLLAQVPEILQNSRINSEKINFIKNLIHDSMLSDDSILDLIALLLKCRRMLEDSKPEDSVSVSAVDSSSNL